MVKIPSAVEILPKISTACVGRTNVTDDRRQIDDRQTTDGQAIAYSEREREFTFANHQKTSSYRRNSVPCKEIGIKESNGDVRTLTGSS